MKNVGIAALLAIGVIMLHTTLHTHLISFVIAPLVLATFFGLILKSPALAIGTIIIVTELTAQTPPGAMTLAILLPLMARPILKTVPMGFTLRFFGLTATLTAGQIGILAGISSYVFGVIAIAWPATLLAILGSSLTAFLICIVWYELTNQVHVR